MQKACETKKVCIMFNIIERPKGLQVDKTYYGVTSTSPYSLQISEKCCKQCI